MRWWKIFKDILTDRPTGLNNSESTDTYVVSEAAKKETKKPRARDSRGRYIAKDSAPPTN
tara:strand:- start:2492 stop:2671 length:180 start_codon:yes stop_codon:yes gene_type:complete